MHMTPAKLRAMTDDQLEGFLAQVAEVVHATEHMSEMGAEADAAYEAENPHALLCPEYLADREAFDIFNELLTENLNAVKDFLVLPVNPHTYGEDCPLH